MTIKEIIAALEQVAKANLNDVCRQGNVVRLRGPGDVVMTGDLHGHERNFEKLVAEAQLGEHPQRHLILHELLHSTDNQTPHECHSYLLVVRAAQLKLQYPGQVHLMLGNHAMAQICRSEVLKNGQAMVRALTAGVTAALGDNANLVLSALDEFILSLPIAVVTDNRVWMSHSLPSLRHLEGFDQGIFETPLTLVQMKTNDSLRALLWDRRHTEETLSKLRKMWDVDMFLVGHQPQANGFKQVGTCMGILASDHVHGCFLRFELGRSYDADELFGLIKPLSSVR